MILNPELYKQAKEIADQTYKTHGAYKSAFLVKKYKELGGEYADDGKPRNLTRWFKEEWKDVANLPYPVYRPTKRVSSETPLTVNEISPESLTRNAFVKQIYENRRNLSPFEGEPYTVKPVPKPEYNYSAPYNGGYLGAGFYRLPNGCSLYTGGALTKKRVSEFSQNVQDIFNLMSVSRKYKIIGSGALQEIKYSADYDLNELFKDEISDKKSALDRLYKVFRDKFIEAKENPDVWITDFKCGEDSNGEPLRWSYEDMMRGYKRMADGRLIPFQECILMKATLKLDMIALIEGRFVEFSDNYFIKLDKDANFFPHDMEKDHLLNSIKHDYHFQMFSARNYFKALKRAFAYYKLEAEGKNEDKLDRLTAFFNTETGLLYKIRSELKTIQAVLEQTFRKVKLEQIHGNIQLIIAQLRGQSEIASLLQSALKQRTPKSISQYLEKASEILFSDINKSTLGFVSQNKNLLLV
jgi:hypothetical protein